MGINVNPERNKSKAPGITRGTGTAEASGIDTTVNGGIAEHKKPNMTHFPEMIGYATNEECDIVRGIEIETLRRNVQNTLSKVHPERTSAYARLKKLRGNGKHCQQRETATHTASEQRGRRDRQLEVADSILREQAQDPQKYCCNGTRRRDRGTQETPAKTLWIPTWGGSATDRGTRAGEARGRSHGESSHQGIENERREN